MVGKLPTNHMTSNHYSASTPEQDSRTTKSLFLILHQTFVQVSEKIKSPNYTPIRAIKINGDIWLLMARKASTTINWAWRYYSITTSTKASQKTSSAIL